MTIVEKTLTRLHIARELNGIANAINIVMSKAASPPPSLIHTTH